MKTLRLDWRKTRKNISKTVTFRLQSMQKYFMSKLYILRETTLFLQGCTIFTVFVTAHLLWAFKELNISESIPKLQIRQQDKTFWRCKLYSFSFVLYFVVCSPTEIQHGGFIRAFLFSIWTPVTWPSTHSRSNISMSPSHASPVPI
jgi:hypothetical protein